MPASAADARDLLIASTLSPDPVLFIDDRWLYDLEDELPPVVELDLAAQRPKRVREGKDLTIVASSYATRLALGAAQELSVAGIEADVIDLRVVNPFHPEEIIASVARTGRLLVVDTGWLNCGASSEILSETFERLAHRRPFVAKRLGYLPTPCPTTKILENLYYPSPQSIAEAAYRLTRGGDAPEWKPGAVDSREVAEFRGPF